MNPARAVFVAVGGCQSMSCLTAAMGLASGLRDDGEPEADRREKVLENEPTYTTRPFSSSRWIGSSGRST